MAAGSGAAYSMNSKPSVPMGLSQAWCVSVANVGSAAFMAISWPLGGNDAALYRRSVTRFRRLRARVVRETRESCKNALMDALDKLDRAILRSLQSDGRATYDQIADHVGLSASAVQRACAGSRTPASSRATSRWCGPKRLAWGSPPT